MGDKTRRSWRPVLVCHHEAIDRWLCPDSQQVRSKQGAVPGFPECLQPLALATGYLSPSTQPRKSFQLHHSGRLIVELELPGCFRMLGICLWKTTDVCFGTESSEDVLRLFLVSKGSLSGL